MNCLSVNLLSHSFSSDQVASRQWMLLGQWPLICCMDLHNNNNKVFFYQCCSALANKRVCKIISQKLGTDEFQHFCPNMSQAA